MKIIKKNTHPVAYKTLEPAILGTLRGLVFSQVVVNMQQSEEIDPFVEIDGWWTLTQEGEEWMGQIEYVSQLLFEGGE